MDALIVAVIVVTALAVVALTVSWFVQRHPEDSADHDFTHDEGAGPTGTPYPPGSRPGGPGAEGMAVPDPGDISPGVPGPEDPRPHG
jgi:hypothetical protein